MKRIFSNRGIKKNKKLPKKKISQKKIFLKGTGINKDLNREYLEKYNWRRKESHKRTLSGKGRVSTVPLQLERIYDFKFYKFYFNLTIQSLDGSEA